MQKYAPCKRTVQKRFHGRITLTDSTRYISPQWTLGAKELINAVLHLFCRADVEEKHASFSSNATETSDLPEMRKRNISIYCALVIGTFLLALAGAGSFLYVAISASQKLHNRMFEKLLGATIYFFDTNPVGK